MTFVLLGRDVTAPAVIREWCRLRCLHGKNTPKDSQITEALACADTMECERPAPAPEQSGVPPCGWCQQGLPLIDGQHQVGNHVETGPIYRACKAGKV